MTDPQRTAAPERSERPDTGEDRCHARGGLPAGVLGRLKADPDQAAERFVPWVSPNPATTACPCEDGSPQGGQQPAPPDPQRERPGRPRELLIRSIQGQSEERLPQLSCHGVADHSHGGGAGWTATPGRCRRSRCVAADTWKGNGLRSR